MKKILIISVFLILLFPYKSYSQVNKTESTLSKKELVRHKSNYAKKMKKLGMACKPEYFYKYKIDLNKAKEFKSVGLDLVKMGNTSGGYSFRESSLVSGLILQGTIVEKKYNKNIEVYFHTTYKVKVESFLKGFLDSDYVYVKTVSGLIGEDEFVNRSTDPKLYIGEKVLLMLNPIDIEGINEARNKGFFEKKLNAKPTDFIIIDKYSLKKNNLFDDDRIRIGEKNKVFSTIKKIILINEDKKFYSKNFNYEK